MADPAPVDAAEPVADDGELDESELTAPEEDMEDFEAAADEGEMSNLMRDVEGEFRSPRRGDVIEGTVMSVDKESIMVDIGTKSEGVIPSQELQRLDPKTLEELKVGDSVFVYVLQPESREGHVLLSLSRAKAERGWAVAQKYFEDGQVFEAEVVDFNRGGLIVNIDGVRGFVPMSQVVGLRHDDTAEPGPESKLAALVGQLVPLKVLEVNRRRNRLILSERLGVQERRQQRKDQLLEELEEGQTRHGRVSSVCDFGAFVDVGGADGLVHLSELSWGPVQHPSHIVQVGEEVDVVVLAVDKDKKKISLSLRRSQPEPWSNVAEKYAVGTLVTATITKLATFGAFARLENGVEGLIHISELSDARIAHPKNVVKEGDVVTLKVLRIDPERRRIGLSLRQVPSEERTTLLPPTDEGDEGMGSSWSIGPTDNEDEE